MNQLPLIIETLDYKMRKRSCDGLCASCGEWSFENADPVATGIYCDQCENKSVAGVDAAIAMKILIVY